MVTNVTCITIDTKSMVESDAGSQRHLDSQLVKHPHIMMLCCIRPRDVHHDAIWGHYTLKLDGVDPFPPTVKNLLVEKGPGNRANSPIDESKNSLTHLHVIATVCCDCFGIFAQLSDHQMLMIPVQNGLYLQVHQLNHPIHHL